MRARAASTASTGETLRARISAASSSAGSQMRSSAATGLASHPGDRDDLGARDTKHGGANQESTHASNCIIIVTMDRAAPARLAAWLDRAEILALDPPRLEALRDSLSAPGPPIWVGRWGTLVGFEAGRVPHGAGSAVLNLVAALMKDQGVARVRYRGPFPSERLFTTLLECFRYDPRQTLPLERFVADGGLDWLPAPYESHRVAPWVTVSLRESIDTVTADGITFSRPDWQGVARREPRVVRVDGERVRCSFWVLGGPLEDRLGLDQAGEVLEAPAAKEPEAAPAPLPPFWHTAPADLIARERAAPLAAAIKEVLRDVAIEWGAVPDDLLRAWDRRIRLSGRLREAGQASLRGAAPGQERAEQALRFILEVARLLGPEVRTRAQALLEALPESEQRRRLEAAAAEPPPELDDALDESVGKLIALVARSA